MIENYCYNFDNLYFLYKLPNNEILLSLEMPGAGGNSMALKKGQKRELQSNLLRYERTRFTGGGLFSPGVTALPVYLYTHRQIATP